MQARKLCPQAEYVEGDPGKYIGVSLQLLELYLTITPDVEPFSVDEAFVGLGGKTSLEQALEVARRLQGTIAERFGLGASIGIGPNKLVAKMAAGLEKPRGLTALDEDGFRGAFWPMDVEALWGVGPKIAARMRSLGMKTVGDLARAPESILKGAFGIVGPQLREAAHGHDDTPLVPYHEGLDSKSMGHEVTLPEDCAEEAFLEGTLLRLSDQVGRRLRGEGFVARTVVLKLRDSAFLTVTRQRALAEATDEGSALFEIARRLFRSNWKGGPVRLLGVSAAALERRAEGEQTELFRGDIRARRLLETMDLVRDRLGEASLVPAGALRHRSELGHIPFGAISAKVRSRR